ncbi:hypothetical protein FLX56_11105 [Synechococcus moorigangaii CMS01]|nr:hypothetical protein [Synechococcus moorigangaii CMS01]
MDALTDRAFAMAKAGQGDAAAITALRNELAAQAGRITSDMDRLELAMAGLETDLDRLAGELDPLDAALMALDRLAQETGVD